MTTPRLVQRVFRRRAGPVKDSRSWESEGYGRDLEGTYALKDERPAVTAIRLALAGVGLLALLTLGCSPPDPTPTVTFTALPTATPTPSQPATEAPPTEQPHQDPAAIMEAGLLAFGGDLSGIHAMGESGDPSYIPVLVEFLRFPWYLDADSLETIHSSLASLIGQETEGLSEPQQDWDWWVDWMGNHPEILPPQGFAGWKGLLFSALVDPETGAFLYDGVKARIRLEEIVWGGVKKDGIPDLTNPPAIPAEKASYLNPQDRVFGVSFNGQHRAYPHRILNPHEMANDVVGGVAFALAY